MSGLACSSDLGWCWPMAFRTPEQAERLAEIFRQFGVEMRYETPRYSYWRTPTVDRRKAERLQRRDLIDRIEERYGER